MIVRIVLDVAMGLLLAGFVTLFTFLLWLRRIAESWDEAAARSERE